MSTPLDLHILRSLPELQAAKQLAAAPTHELWEMCDLLDLRPKSNTPRTDLIALILSHTHPARPAPAAPVVSYVQEHFL